MTDHRIGFVGAGNMAAALIEGLLRTHTFSSNQVQLSDIDPAKAQASGQDLGLAEARSHGSWEALLADELARPAAERIDLVSIVTPNHLHFPVARAFVDSH